MIPWGWLTIYQKRRALGLCSYEYCQDLSKPDRAMCAHHALNKKRYCREYNARDYLSRKLSGRCVSKGCKELQGERSFHCEKHLAFYSEACRRYRATRRGKERRRVLQRRAKERKKELGICTVGACPAALVTETMCDKHREEKQRYRAAKRREDGIPVTTQHCRNCMGLGHNSITCKKRKEDKILLTEYATARTEVVF